MNNLLLDEEFEEYDYYNEQDFAQDRFYKIDKRLFENARYKGLSLGAKVVYGILKDRQCLSESNKKDWLDERGRIFFYFDCEKLSKLLEISTSTLNRHKRELEKYRLLSQARQGQGRPNKMFCIKPKSIDNSLISQNDNSRKVKMTKLELSKRLTSKTEFNETYINETENTSSFNKLHDMPSKYETIDDFINDFLETVNLTITELEILKTYAKLFHKKYGYSHFVLKTNEIINTHYKLQEFIEFADSFNDNTRKEIIDLYIDSFFRNNKTHSIFLFLNHSTVMYHLKRLKILGSEIFEVDGSVKKNYND